MQINGIPDTSLLKKATIKEGKLLKPIDGKLPKVNN